jgi:ABC-2 type transport system permease protein
MATPEGFFNLQPFSILLPMLFIVFAVARGSDATAGEEERGTLDLLLANPLRRSRLVLEKSLAHGGALLALAFLFWLAMAGCTRLFAIVLNLWRLAAVTFSCWLLGMAFYALALAAGCWRGRKKFSIGVSGGVAVTTFLVNAYAPMVERLRPWRVLSPFYYYNGDNVLSNGLVPAHALVLAGLAAFFFVLALLAFGRRDLSA